MKKKEKLAVLFPGVGYSCDRSLLYFAGKIAEGEGYELRKVKYGKLPGKIRGDREKMQAAFESAAAETDRCLADEDWEKYEDILFISKSIGTIVAADYAKRHGLKVRSVSYTPLKETFWFAEGPAIMFHGTADPWAPDTEAILAAAEKAGIPVYLTENANHSLETGEVLKDLETLRLVMERTEAFIRQGREAWPGNRETDMESVQ